MRISLIVTTWGVEPWIEDCRASLRKALDSVRKAGCDLEVETIEICNGNGVAAARNEGFAKATGDYVWFVDGDDVVRPDALVLIRDAFARHPGADVVHFNLQSFERVEEFLTQRHGGTEEKSAVEVYDLRVLRERVKAYRRHARWLLASNTVYRRNLVADMRFEPLVKGEDSLWGRRAFYRAKSLVYLPAALYGYRRRADGADQTHDARHYADAKRAVWLMLVEGLRVKGIRFWVLVDWLRDRFRTLPVWYRHGTRNYDMLTA